MGPTTSGVSLLIRNNPQALLTCCWSFHGSCGFLLLESSIYWYELPLPGISKSLLLYGNKSTWIIPSSVMQEVFMQPLPLCSTYFLSKRLIHTTKALWTSFFPSAKNRSWLKLISHFSPLQGQNPVTLTLAERGRMHSRLAQQESWGPNMPLSNTKHSVWLPSRSLGFTGLILQSLLRQHSHWLPQNFCLSKDPWFGPEVKKKPSQLSNVGD